MVIYTVTNLKYLYYWKLRMLSNFHLWIILTNIFVHAVLLFICCLLRYSFGTSIFESMVKIIETDCQVALKYWQISPKNNMRVFLAWLILKVILLISVFILFYSLDQNNLRNNYFLKNNCSLFSNFV